MESNDLCIVKEDSNSEDSQPITENNEPENDGNSSNSEMHVTFLPSFIIPPRPKNVPRIRIPIEPIYNFNRTYSQRLNCSPRISKPVYFDLPPMPTASYPKQITMPSNSKIKSQKNKSVKYKRPVSSRDSYNITLDSLLGSIEKEMSSPRRRTQQSSNIRNERCSSSRRSTNSNHLTMFQTKTKVQKPLFSRSYRNELEKSSINIRHGLNSKYPK